MRATCPFSDDGSPLICQALIWQAVGVEDVEDLAYVDPEIMAAILEQLTDRLGAKMLQTTRQPHYMLPAPTSSHQIPPDPASSHQIPPAGSGVPSFDPGPRSHLPGCPPIPSSTYPHPPHSATPSHRPAAFRNPIPPPPTAFRNPIPPPPTAFRNPFPQIAPCSHLSRCSSPLLSHPQHCPLHPAAHAFALTRRSGHSPSTTTNRQRRASTTAAAAAAATCLSTVRFGIWWLQPGSHVRAQAAAVLRRSLWTETVGRRPRRAGSRRGSLRSPRAGSRPGSHGRADAKIAGWVGSRCAALDDQRFRPSGRRRRLHDACTQQHARSAQPADRTVNQHTHQHTHQSGNQSANQSGNQSANQSGNQ